MTPARYLLRKVMWAGHRLGLNHNHYARAMVDSIKRFLGETPVPFSVKIQGFHFRGISMHDRLLGSYEPETTALFRREVKPGMVVLDIGAQLGYFTLLLAKLVGPTGKVYAFEPFKEMYEKLAENIDRNRNLKPMIALVNKGAGDSQKTYTYYIPSASVFPVKKENTAADLEKMTTKIECLPLDDYFSGRLVPIDFIKMDIEGAEQLALRGMENIFRSNHGIKMVIEVAPKVLDKIGKNPADLLSQLRGYGFQLERIRADGTTEPDSDVNIIMFARANRYINIYCHR